MITTHYDLLTSQTPELDSAVDRPTGGLTVSLDKVAKSLCQTWIAWGSGDADFDEKVVDDNGIVRTDRVDEGYTLQRVNSIRELVQSGTLAIGVDRLDYTKGILKRLEAIEQALSTTPELYGDLVYLQIASKSREQIPSYRRYHQQVLEKVDEINQTYGTGDWRPVVYTDERLPREAVLYLLKRAEVCIVSSRRDGLNLVAEEFVAASRNNPGELLLSEFTGLRTF